MHCFCVTGPLKKYGTLQPASELPAQYADMSGQGQQQFTRYVSGCCLLHTVSVSHKKHTKIVLVISSTKLNQFL